MPKRTSCVVEGKRIMVNDEILTVVREEHELVVYPMDLHTERRFRIPAENAHFVRRAGQVRYPHEKVEQAIGELMHPERPLWALPLEERLPLVARFLHSLDYLDTRATDSIAEENENDIEAD